jgi:type II secretory pathway pseudopilin PulG
MSVVLIGIGLALALPSYRDMVEKRQVTNGAEQLASFVNSAQGSAQLKNKKVTISYKRTNDNQWCVGMAEGDAVCNCKDEPDACTVDGATFVLGNDSAGDRVLMHSAESETHGYYFDPVRGLFLPCQGENLAICEEIDVSDQASILASSNSPLDLELRSQSGDFRLSLMVSNTGRVILCSVDDNHAVPGYKRCQEG